MGRNCILIIDDEEKLRKLLAKTLSLEGYEVLTAANAHTGLQLLADTAPQVVLLDVKLPDGNGIDLTRQIKEKHPATEVIVMTAFGTIKDGVQAMHNAAFDYLVKGDDNEKIIPLVSKAMEKAQLQFRIADLEQQVDHKYSFEQVIGTSAALDQVLHMARKVAPTTTSVLLLGETGTGKEVFARAIHQGSPRKQRNFVALNCGAFSKDLLESEMFGHKAGAFTGAIKDKKGLFEEADHGTIFLDELGEMTLDLQAKLLRVLESGTFIKVGETRETQVDVRIIAATNRNLEEEIETGRFRADLFYRLATFQLYLPSLNERKEDIPLLAAHFIKTIAPKVNSQVRGMADNFQQALQKHHWKGNIRELRNTIERCIILAEGSLLTANLLPFDFLKHTYAEKAQPHHLELALVEKEHIQQVLQYTHGNKTKTAEALGIGLTTLYRKIQEYGLE